MIVDKHLALPDGTNAQTYYGSQQGLFLAEIGGTGSYALKALNVPDEGDETIVASSPSNLQITLTKTVADAGANAVVLTKAEFLAALAAAQLPTPSEGQFFSFAVAMSYSSNSVATLSPSSMQVSNVYLGFSSSMQFFIYPSTYPTQRSLLYGSFCYQSSVTNILKVETSAFSSPGFTMNFNTVIHW